MKFYSKKNPSLFIELVPIEGAKYCGYNSNIPYEDRDTFMEICNSNRIGYYAAPHEKFFILEALELKRARGYKYMILEDLS